MIGRVISHYKITDQLGQGGMGVVYRAQDLSLGREVALKFVTAGLAGDREARLRFANEAKAASSLEHPNICTIHEIGQTEEGQTYIVMPFYDGETLSERSRRGVSPDEAADLIRQAALGLAKAHERGIIHRDVKSQNLLVTSDGFVKVVDFGLAKLAGQTRMTQTGATLGTLQYMSPEQVRGEDVDARTDIYSLGVVLYELLTGTLPYAADIDAAVVYSIVNTEPEPPTATRPGIPAALDSVVMRAISKDRESRYPDFAAMIADLDLALAGVMPAAPMTKSGGSSSGLGRDRARTLPWARVAILALIAAAVVASSMWYRSSLDVDRTTIPEDQPGVRFIGVMYFENLSGDPALDWMQEGVVELLNTALSRSSELTLLDSQRMARIVHELGGNPDAGVNQSMASDVARKAGVRSMLVGNIIKSGETIRLQAKMIDVETGQILHSDYVDGLVDDDVFGMVAELTEKLQIYLGISSIAETVDEAWIREITTTSVTGYRDYVQGRRYFIQNQHARAQEYFERAIDADPDFIMAYVDLMGSCFNLGDFACIGAAYEEALRLRPNASRKERLYIDVTGAIMNGEADKQIVMAKELVALDPTAQFWRYILGRGYYMSKRYEEALIEWMLLVEDGYDWVWTYAYASDACIELNRYDQGLRIIARGFEITPPNNASVLARLHRYRGRVYRAIGDQEKALADFRACVEFEPEYEPVINYDLGLLYEQEGDSERAIEHFEAYIAADPNGTHLEDARARIERLRGRPQR